MRESGPVNICMVLADKDFPPDIRVEKEARSLISAGHRVFLLCVRTGESPASSVCNGIETRRIAPLPFLVRMLNTSVYLLSTRDLQWKRAIRKLIAAHAIDAIHVHDLPKVGTALSAARGKGVPVIADLHENYPALVRRAFARRKPRLAERFMPPGRWQRLERRWGKRCRHILAVVDEGKERLVAEGVSPDKITVIENTVDVDYFLSLPIDDGLAAQFRDDFVICYTGGFSPWRGLDTAVRAMPRILGEVPNAKLLFVGDGEMMPKLRFLTKTMGLDGKVVFTGWEEFHRVPGYIAASDVCIVPHASNEQTEVTAPHKLYQYMLMGKPVVVSSCRPLQRIVESARCGLVFEAGDAQAFAACILKLKDAEVRRKLGEAGKRAVREELNWHQTARKLLLLYRTLSTRGEG
ncbi:glycosyltransferase family 4 protein [bacterium]|nr:glycosyltransferase family 4 protein [bacterium]